MATTFISKLGSATPIGTIVLWYGTKASIPAGWSYYSAAAGYWVKGAASANITPQNTQDHDHPYSAQTGLAGGHAGHGFTLSVGAATDGDTSGYTTAGTENNYWAQRLHSNHTIINKTEGADPNHSHPLLTTGKANVKPASIGLFYIKKVS